MVVGGSGAISGVGPEFDLFRCKREKTLKYGKYVFVLRNYMNFYIRYHRSRASVPVVPDVKIHVKMRASCVASVFTSYHEPAARASRVGMSLYEKYKTGKRR